MEPTYNEKAKRVLVIGLDAMSPKLTLKMAKEGVTPNIRKLMDEGCFAKALSSPPAFTPTNWTVIATGARPGRSGIFLWGTHIIGEEFTDIHRDEAMSSNICRAEYIWETAAKVGKKTLLFNFVGWPPTTNKAIHVDWFHSPSTKCFQIAGNMCYTTIEPCGIATRIRFSSAEGWSNIPKNSVRLLEATMPIVTVEGTKVDHNLLLVDEGEGFRKCVISLEKDFEKGLCVLSTGEWSSWFRERFSIDGQEKEGTVRFKLLELSSDGTRFKLYRSQVYPEGGFTYPLELGKELVKDIGPYIQEAAGRAFIAGWIDEETLSEEFCYQARWIGKATKKIMDEHDCSLFFIQWHFLDTLFHGLMDRIDPEGTNYRSDEAERHWDTAKLAYRLADNLVGEIVKAANEDTIVTIVSDHGMPIDKKMVSLLDLFARKGWTKTKPVEEGGISPDWSETKAICLGLHIWINLKGRDPHGIVEPEEYDSLREEIIDTLLSLRDKDGKRPILLALRKEDAPIIGISGEGIGDIVFIYERGYAWGSPFGLPRPTRDIVQRIGGAHHGPQPPTTETKISSNYATFIMSGPGIKKNYTRDLDRLGPMELIDVAPTLAYLLGIPAPAHSQGTVLHDMFVGEETRITRNKGPIPSPSIG